MVTSLHWTPCKLKRDSQGAYCETCDRVFSNLTPWHYSKSKYLHEGGTGHKVIWVKLERQEAGQ